MLQNIRSAYEIKPADRSYECSGVLVHFLISFKYGAALLSSFSYCQHWHFDTRLSTQEAEGQLEPKPFCTTRRTPPKYNYPLPSSSPQLSYGNAPGKRCTGIPSPGLCLLRLATTLRKQISANAIYCRPILLRDECLLQLVYLL